MSGRNQILADGSNRPKSGIPTKKSGIPTPKPSLKREATSLTSENVKFEPEPKVPKPSYMRPTASRAAARKSLAKARRSMNRVGAVRNAVVRAASPKFKRTAVQQRGTTATRGLTTTRTTALSSRTTSRTTTSRAGPMRAAASTRPGTAKKAAAVSDEPEEAEDASPASRVRVSKEGKLIVKGVDKFNKMERNRIVELVCAEKILECKRNSDMLNSINETLQTISAQKQKAEEDKEQLHKNFQSKGIEMEMVTDKLEAAQRENKKLKREIDDKEEELDAAHAKTKKIIAERDDLAEDYASSSKKIGKLEFKLEQSQKEVQRQENEIERLNELNAEQTKKLEEADEERKLLHEQIQQLKGNIRVFSRVRPLLSKEVESGSTSDHIAFNGAPGKGLEITREDKKDKADFEFDKVFQPTSKQSEVFDEVQQLVRSSLDGYNVCIFAYGQTGSGKTFSMEGPDDVDDTTKGIIPRSFDYLIDTIEQAKEKGWTYELEASYLEIYCEELRDLCAQTPDGKKLDIIASGSNLKHINVQHLSSHKVTNQAQINNLIKRAKKRRATAATNCNERSSRSHSVFVLNITGHNSRTDLKISSCLNLIDLAGSERVKESGATGQRFEEAKKINSSLSSLGDVIAALGAKSKHVPYRNSKLTHLLKNSLGGNAKTLMIMHLNPNKVFANESLNTLRFAQKVNNTNIGTAQKVVK